LISWILKLGYLGNGATVSLGNTYETDSFSTVTAAYPPAEKNIIKISGGMRRLVKGLKVVGIA
jgi:predicted acyl esterase